MEDFVYSSEMDFHDTYKIRYYRVVPVTLTNTFNEDTYSKFKTDMLSMGEYLASLLNNTHPAGLITKKGTRGSIEYTFLSSIESAVVLRIEIDKKGIVVTIPGYTLGAQMRSFIAAARGGLYDRK